MQRDHQALAIGQRIRAVREDCGLTQVQVARQAGLSKGYLSDVEAGKRNVGSAKLLGLADALGASLEWLLTGESGESRSVRVSEPVVIPPELGQAAEEMDLSYAATLECLALSQAVLDRPRRAGWRDRNRLTAARWKALRRGIEEVFGRT